jgi:hypothetical protein
MKKSLLAIVFAAASLPLTFGQTPAPANQSKPATDQKSTAAPKAKKTSKHKTSTSKTGASASSTPSTPQK